MSDPTHEIGWTFMAWDAYTVAVIVTKFATSITRIRFELGSSNIGWSRILNLSSDFVILYLRLLSNWSRTGAVLSVARLHVRWRPVACNSSVLRTLTLSRPRLMSASTSDVTHWPVWPRQPFAVHCTTMYTARQYNTGLDDNNVPLLSRSPTTATYTGKVELWFHRRLPIVH